MSRCKDVKRTYTEPFDVKRTYTEPYDILRTYTQPYDVLRRNCADIITGTFLVYEDTYYFEFESGELLIFE